ncbi:MAG: PAS domain-containing protein, partial [Acidobacteria bacterium]|nr:PAS domain-containing protein [Acidobacteriota bacterium]
MPAFVLCVALFIASAALFFWSPAASVVAVAFALAGALVARLTLRLSSDASSSQLEPIAPHTSADTIARPVNLKPPAIGNMVALPEAVPASELLPAVLDSMREGMLVVDGELRVVAANAAANAIFSTAGKAAGARRLSDLTRNPAILSAFLAAVERGERVEIKVETAEGDQRAFDLRVTPLWRQTPKNGGERGAVGVFFDITRLERLERVRQEFLSNVSHELRTPLTAILAFVETLTHGTLDDQENTRRFLLIIERNAARMHNLIDDILELSAIEAGTVKVEVAPVPLRALVNHVITALAGRAAERQVELINEVSESIVVSADARRLEQMLTNLTDNAIKFNQPGGQVRIKHDQTEGRDRIAVTDTGEGIAPDHIHRIFERFYCVDRARSRALGGTGLGLAIVKHLARAHGGEAT